MSDARPGWLPDRRGTAFRRVYDDAARNVARIVQLCRERCRAVWCSVRSRFASNPVLLGTRWNPMEHAGSPFVFIPSLLALSVSFAFLGDWIMHTRGEWLHPFVAAILAVVAAVALGLGFLVLLAAVVSFRGVALAGVLTAVPLGLLVLVSMTAACVEACACLVRLAVVLLSALVFIPLRLGQSVSAWSGGSSWRCPHDDCGRDGKPLHVCSCGARYADLRPSYRGVVHHRCRHGDVTVLLPTLDCFGRDRLARLCRHCQKPILFPTFGKWPERSIAIIGGTGEERCQVVRGLIRTLCAVIDALPGGSARPICKGDARDWPASHALGLMLDVPRRLRCTLYLHDVPGKDCGTIERLGRKQALAQAVGFVLVVDRSLLQALEPVVGAFLAAVRQMLASREADTCSVPLAVVLSGDGGDVREALGRHGAGNEVRALEHRFRQVRYFRSAGPERECEALAWLLHLCRQDSG